LFILGLVSVQVVELIQVQSLDATLTLSILSFAQGS
jgi:hypothetical protein